MIGILRLLLDHAEDFFLAHDEVLAAVDLDFLAGVLAEQNRVARLDVERRDLPPSFSIRPLRGDILPCWGFSLAVSGMMMPPTFCSAFFDAFDDDLDRAVV